MFGVMREVVTLKRPLYGNTDRYGNDAPDWSDDSSFVENVRAFVAPTSANEDDEPGERTTSEFRFVFATSAEVEADWRIEWNDQEFEVVGRPMVFSHMLGRHHVEVVGRIVEG
jgi:head-tail adaptor